MSALLTPQSRQVRRFDWATRQYVPGEKSALLLGPDLDRHLQATYKRTDGRAYSAYLKDEGISLADVFTELSRAYDLPNMDPRRFNRQEMRAVTTDDRIRPWFGPVVVEGFELGIASTSYQWEDLIGRTIPITAQSAEWFNLTGAGTDEDYTLMAVAQGAPIPVAKITVGHERIVIMKSGRGIEITREASAAPVDLVSLWLTVLGKRLSRTKLLLVADRAINGYLADNSDDPTVLPTATQNVFTLGDMLQARYQLEVTNGYTCTHILMSPGRHIGLLTAIFPGTYTPLFADDAAIAAKLGGAVKIVPGMDDALMVFQDSGVALVRFEAEPFGTEDSYEPRNQIYATFGTESDQITPAPGILPARVLLDAR